MELFSGAFDFSVFEVFFAFALVVIQQSLLLFINEEDTYFRKARILESGRNCTDLGSIDPNSFFSY